MESTRVVLYESSSRGGCYQYSLYLLKAFNSNPGCKEFVLILPSNADVHQKPVKKILLPDLLLLNTITRKIYFLLRHFVNPFILLIYLLFKKSSIVILNDFEQLSAVFWVPVYKVLFRKHRFGVYLHDPDRDAYPPSKAISSMTMKMIMNFASASFYHGELPRKKYYEGVKSKLIPVPHGLYDSMYPDPELLGRILKFKGTDPMIAIIGNIRAEKNYEYAIRAVQQITGLKLFIAGSASSTGFDMEKYTRLADELSVPERIFWHLKYLNENELSACIEASDIILLYYKPSFTSQSGILSSIAAKGKRVIISDIQSGLTRLAKEFHFGTICKAEDQAELVNAIRNLLISDKNEDWSEYLKFADWNNNADIVLKSF